MGEPKGIVHTHAGSEPFILTRYAPSPDVAPFVRRYWTVAWDLRGAPPHRQELVPHPTVNIVIQRGRSALFGVSTTRTAQTLTGKDRVLGVKFHPGGFFPFFGKPLSALTDKAVSLCTAFGGEATNLEQRVLSQQTAADMIDVVESFLRQTLPPPDKNVAVINRIVDAIVSDRTITKVDQLPTSLTKRSLQRLFAQYVGVSPKWVIQRYRIMEAVDLLSTGLDVNWANLALELGYFDQAHFTNDFKRIVGVTPAAYARQQQPVD